MRCVCGHVDCTDLDSNGALVNPDGKPFIEVEGHFTVNVEYYGHQEVYIYACPICQTIKMVDR